MYNFFYFCVGQNFWWIHNVIWEITLLDHTMTLIFLLSGTGTVLVRVADQNDNPPRLARRRWEVEVEEMPLAVPPPNTTLLELTAADRDTTTSLHYRVSLHDEEE